jgi:predicted phage replisome organizer
MADVKWIKITTDVFDDDKILLIESLPDADAIIVIWFKLLCLAGKQNNSGVFIMGNKIPYTEKMLATIFRRKESTVQLALQTFEQFGMIELIDGVITIPNWGKHQSLDQIESRNEYMKKYMKEYREKQKRLTGNTKLCEVGLPMDEWSEVLSFFNHECAYCGSKVGLEQEHIVSVNDGGAYCIGNIVPSCRSCNASKGNKNVDAWYRKSKVFEEERLQKLNEYRCISNVNSLRKLNVNCADKKREEGEKKEIREREEGDVVIPSPTIDEITDYIRNNNLSVNPKRFFFYYEEQEWKTSTGKPINWEQKLQEWDFNDKQKAKATATTETQTNSNPFLALAKEENLF